MSRENQNTRTCDIDDQNTQYVFASNGTHAMYFNPKPQYHQYIGEVQ